MGCDGGTIPKRNEIVKSKQSVQNRDKNADRSAKYQFCALSGLKLKKPIVSCQLGRLYNKDAIIEYLLDRSIQKHPSTSAASTSAQQSQPKSNASHIRSLKDVKTLNLKDSDNFDKTKQASSSTEQIKAQFTCPISGLDFNGKYKFYFLFSCGCVFSERALKELSNDKQCILCSKSYDPDYDLILINGDEEEVEKLKELLLARKRQHRSSKIKSHESNRQSVSKKLKIETSTAVK